MEIRIRAAAPLDQAAVGAFLDGFGMRIAARRDALVVVDELPAMLAERGSAIVGVLAYDIGARGLEIAALYVSTPWAGIGTALLDAVDALAAERGIDRLWLITTNDNVDALRFYQRRGFRLTSIDRGAVDRSRATHKPTIPLVGAYGIPIRDELELERPARSARPARPRSGPLRSARDPSTGVEGRH